MVELGFEFAHMFLNLLCFVCAVVFSLILCIIWTWVVFLRYTAYVCMCVCVSQRKADRQNQRASMHKGAQVCVRKEGRVDKGNISFLLISFLPFKS